jgi:hypothetical protein
LLQLEKADKKSVILRNLADFDTQSNIYPEESQKLVSADLNYQDSDEDEVPARIRDLSPTAKTKASQQYLHFGLKNALLGTSLGLTHRKTYLTIWRLFSVLQPGLLSTKLARKLSQITTKKKEVLQP